MRRPLPHWTNRPGQHHSTSELRNSKADFTFTGVPYEFRQANPGPSAPLHQGFVSGGISTASAARNNSARHKTGKIQDSKPEGRRVEGAGLENIRGSLIKCDAKGLELVKKTE
ncbi:hypothetical protein DPEC_G00007750 [Dallia pectoralis]|uniref:Uncharacterized protein n=1 Tax=Dallia pectoralis TaxID=75939 RepID=A0ACC2HKU4_DALPE|nr:hypothetical protein DPEC_G00007750 [Dallia pectoralis]